MGSGNRDVIQDFGGGDKLDVSALLTVSGWLGTGAFTGGGGAQMRYEFDGSNTLVKFDGNGDGTADMEVQLVGAVNLGTQHFVFG